jgi:Flp pilus assembly protein TadG
MLKVLTRHSSSARGAALVELAVALPLLVLVIVGTIDFGRVFYMAMVLQNAARAGAQYGANSSGAASDVPGMQNAAKTSAAFNIGTISAFASESCMCANDNGALSATSPANDCSNACTGNHLVISVTVTAASTFTLISGYPIPGIPRSFSVSRDATMRAQ